MSSSSEKPISWRASSPRMEPSLTTEGEGGPEVSCLQELEECLLDCRSTGDLPAPGDAHSRPVAMPFEMADDMTLFMLSGKRSKSSKSSFEGPGNWGPWGARVGGGMKSREEPSKGSPTSPPGELGGEGDTSRPDCL